MNDFNVGEPAAFNSVFKLFFQPLSYFAFKIIKDNAQAEDFAIMALHNVMEQCSMFNDFEKLQGYLFTMVKNKCLNYIKSKKEKHQSLEGEDLRDNNTIVNHIIKTELLAEVVAESNKLAPMRKRVFDMFYLQGASNEAIVKKLKIKQGSVYMYKIRCIDQIKKILTIKNSYP